jgi:hypothetical protein
MPQLVDSRQSGDVMLRVRGQQSVHSPRTLLSLRAVVAGTGVDRNDPQVKAREPHSDLARTHV